MLVAAAMGVIAVGIAAGVFLTRGAGGLERIADEGQLVEVHVGTGDILVGIFQGDADGFVHLSLAATITAEPAASGQPPAFRVRLLSVDPYDLEGEVLIAREQVLLAGPVAAGSPLEDAYRQALGEPGETPSP
jgi:hypothetical protein